MRKSQRQNQFLKRLPAGPGHGARLQAASPRALPGQHPTRVNQRAPARDRELFLLSLAYGNKSGLEEKGVPAVGRGQAGWVARSTPCLLGSQMDFQACSGREKEESPQGLGAPVLPCCGSHWLPGATAMQASVLSPANEWEIKVWDPLSTWNDPPQH